MFSKTPEILSLVLFGVFFVGILGLGFLRDFLCVFFGFEGAWRFFCGVLVLVLFYCFSIKQLLYLYLVLPMLWLKGNKKGRRGLQTLIFVGTVLTFSAVPRYQKCSGALPAMQGLGSWLL